jgi:hypothetical protein
MENVVVFYDHLEYFTVIWYKLWPFGVPSLWSFGIFFPVLVCLHQEKSGNPGRKTFCRNRHKEQTVEFHSHVTDLSNHT